MCAKLIFNNKDLGYCNYDLKYNSYESLIITPKTKNRTMIPSKNKIGFNSIIITGVDHTIDYNIQEQNIKKNINILGVTGSYETLAPYSYYIEKQLSNNQIVTNTYKINKLMDIKDVDNYVLQYVYYGDLALQSIDLSSLTTVSGEYGCQYMFSGCTSLTSVDLSLLTTVSGKYGCAYMFANCTSLPNIDLSSLTTVSGQYAFQYMFSGCTSLTSVDLSSLTTVSGTNYSHAFQHMFSGCTNLISVDLSSLTNISGGYICEYMFENCTSLVTVDLSSLININGDGGYACDRMFVGCTGLTSVDLSNLTTISISYGALSMFRGCSSLASISFPSLNTMSGNNCCQHMLNTCTSLASVSFPALTSASFGSYTNQFNSMLYGVTGCTVHFPSNLQSVIGSWSSVINGFGGTNTTVLFDLSATS